MLLLKTEVWYSEGLLVVILFWATVSETDIGKHVGSGRLITQWSVSSVAVPGCGWESPDAPIGNVDQNIPQGLPDLHNSLHLCQEDVVDLSTF